MFNSDNKTLQNIMSRHIYQCETHFCQPMPTNVKPTSAFGQNCQEEKKYVKIPFSCKISTKSEKDVLQMNSPYIFDQTETFTIL